MRTILVFAAMIMMAGQTLAKDPLPRSTPEAEGVQSSSLLRLVQSLDKEVNSMHSLMVLRNGKVICEAWWAPHTSDEQHVMWSLSKSFTSTAVGLAIADGKVNLDDPVSRYFPEQFPADASDHLRSMTVRDLLMMATGHETEPPFWDHGPSIAGFFSHPVKLKPGSRFLYNTPATYMQSAIVQAATGQSVLEYLNSRLFEPLGIDSPKWDPSSEGISLGGYGLHIRTEDIAKFGQLYLQKGNWKGRQLVAESWIEQATSKQISNGDNPNSDWAQGHGFQFWRCRNNAFRGDGKDGQFCIVLPEHNAVIAMTANSDNMQLQLDVLWRELLPAFQANPLAADAVASEQLVQFSRSLSAKR